MSVRAVLAVALTVALLGASLPAVDDARAERTRATLDADLRGVAAAATDVAASDDPVPPGRGGARRIVRLRVPERAWTAAGVEYVAVGRRPADGEGGALAYRLDGGPPRRLRVPGVRLRAADGDPAGVVVRRAGVHRLALGLVDRGGAPTVTVGRREPRAERAPPRDPAEVQVPERGHRRHGTRDAPQTRRPRRR